MVTRLLRFINCFSALFPKLVYCQHKLAYYIIVTLWYQDWMTENIHLWLLSEPLAILNEVNNRVTPLYQHRRLPSLRPPPLKMKRDWPPCTLFHLPTGHQFHVRLVSDNAAILKLANPRSSSCDCLLGRHAQYYQSSDPRNSFITAGWGWGGQCENGSGMHSVHSTVIHWKPEGLGSARQVDQIVIKIPMPSGNLAAVYLLSWLDWHYYLNDTLERAEYLLSHFNFVTSD
jgi:hypothetical protein